MGWADLLEKEEASITVPWTGGGRLVAGDRAFQVEGDLPREHGWHAFLVKGGRTATWSGPATTPGAWEDGRAQQKGYLAGNRLVPDGAAVVLDPLKMLEQTIAVHLVELGLERFARALVAQADDARWIYVRQEFPLGPEAEVTRAYEERRASIDDIPAVTPALDLCFRWERWGREQANERRRALAQLEAARAAEDARRAAIHDALATGTHRNLLASDFDAAASAALLLSGAELLDTRAGRNRGERVVRFRHLGMRFECVVAARNLRIVDAGICLTDHETAERGDAYFTLESLPGVIRQAWDEGVLHQFRHVDD